MAGKENIEHEFADANRHVVEVPDSFAIARWPRNADGATIAQCILGTLQYEPHTADLTAIRHALEECDPMLNLNRANLSLEPINGAINDAIQRVAATAAELPRPYLGASIVGHECLRRIQYDWWCKPTLAARTREIFERGHYFEERTRRHLMTAGFKFAPSEALAFTAADGALRGHADGIIIHGPDLLGVYLIYPAIWEHKCLNARSWREVERDGLEKNHSNYLAQVALYQVYLKVTNPALFTATNADTCERLHFFVPFDAERAQQWSDRAVNIITATRAGELLPRAYDDPSNFRCRMCPHRERCWR
jgi:PD-(D/E)XK nuclease superfamily